MTQFIITPRNVLAMQTILNLCIKLVKSSPLYTFRQKPNLLFQNPSIYSNNIQTSSYAADASQKGGAFVNDSKPIDIPDDDLSF
ncbi:TPA: hypothetical protein U0V99_001691 [Listeria monocytogenes]|nr:hypothetical protein [Listeria monocytogenes]